MDELGTRQDRRTLPERHLNAARRAARRTPQTDKRPPNTNTTSQTAEDLSPFAVFFLLLLVGKLGDAQTRPSPAEHTLTVTSHFSLADLPSLPASSRVCSTKHAKNRKWNPYAYITPYTHTTHTFTKSIYVYIKTLVWIGNNNKLGKYRGVKDIWH